VRSAIGLLLLAGTLAACSERPPAPTSASAILLVTLDTTRADRIGAYGHAPARTATIDRLARDGVLFEQALAPTPITRPSHASMFTGLYPPDHGVYDNTLFRLSPDAELASEALARNGWRTGAFVGAYVLDAGFGLDQGFEIYRGPEATGRKRGLYLERPASRVVDDALAWISGLGEDERFFAWIHFFEPHFPYEPPETVRDVGDPYDGEIAACDVELARLLGALEQRRRASGLAAIVTSDHGESLGEHGEATHGVFVYQSTLRVPLIVWGTGVARGVRVSRRVSTADVAPTLLELAGLPRSELPATTLPPLVARAGPVERDAQRALYVESRLPFFSFRWHALRGIVVGDHKLVVGRDVELYELQSDPGERLDLAGSQPRLAAELLARLDGIETQAPASGGIAPDPTRRELLRQLGYLAGEGDPFADPFERSLPDPRERIPDVRLISLADNLMRRAHRLVPEDPDERAARTPEKLAKGLALLERARDVLRELHSNHPYPHVMADLGTAESRLGNPEAAVPLLEEAIGFMPDVADLRYELALCYAALGRHDDALRTMRSAAALAPDRAHYVRWLERHGG
jgi:arylsulfatase A-like enzyme